MQPKIAELIPFTAAGPPTVDSPSLPFCVRFKLRLRREPYTQPATLDTGRVANTYARRESHPLVNQTLPVRTFIDWFVDHLIRVLILS
jgi:hypothetical protein